MELADLYIVPIQSKMTKAEIRKSVIAKLVKEEVLSLEAYSLCTDEGGSATLSMIKN